MIDREVPYSAVVGFVLRSQRKSLGISQVEASRALGVTPSHWSKAEKGLVRVNALKLALFAQLVAVPTSRFFSQIEEAVRLLELGGTRVTKELPPPAARDWPDHLLKTEQIPGLLLEARSR